jgi:uncharacterized protein (TIGR02271 family)
MPIDLQPNDIIGRTVVGRDGEKLGEVGNVFLDDETGRPEWVTVRTGMFGMKETFVPLSQASTATGELAVPYDKDTVKGAPKIDAEGHLSEEEEDTLYRHYGVGTGGYADTGVVRDRDYTDTTVVDRDRDTGRAGTDDAMTRSEERLRVGTERREAGRARLRKYVVTENVTQTVPVSREEVRLEREPITEANRDEALSGPEISEAEHEVTLTEERPVVQKETVPVERVRLGKDQVTDEERVSEEVRKEQITGEGPGVDREFGNR